MFEGDTKQDRRPQRRTHAQKPQTSPLLSFVALGDVGTRERGQYAIAHAMNRYFSHTPFSLVLLTGDNIYSIRV